MAVSKLFCRNQADYGLSGCACFVFKRVAEIKVRKLVLLLNQNRQLILCVWSSSEYDYRYAWIANANNGGVNWENSKNGKPYYVRCVLALGNKIKKYFCRNLPDYGLAG